MTMLRVLKWTAVIVIMVIVTAVLYLSFGNLDWLKPRIESAVAEATGRQLTLGGTFDLDIIPSPAIVLENVSFSNADWGSNPTMAKVGHFSARIDFWSLLAGPVRVEDFQLREVEVLLETNAQGEANWVIGGTPEPEPSEEVGEETRVSGGSPVLVEVAEIRDVKLVYRTSATDDFVAVLAALDVSVDESEHTLLEGKGELRQLPVRLTGKVGPAQALASGKDINIDLNAGLGNVDVAIDGTVGELATASGLDLKAVTTSDDVAQILADFAIDLPLKGALRVETTLTSVESGTRLAVDATAGDIAASATATHADQTIDFEAAVPAVDKVGTALAIEGLPAQDLAVNGRIVFEVDAYELRAITAQLGETEVKLNGTIGKATDAAEFSVGAVGPNLAALNPGLPALPFKAATMVSLAPEHLVLDAIETTFGESDLSGTIELSLGDKIAIAARVKSKQLDLTPFAAVGETDSDATEPASDSETEEDKAEFVFVDEPLPFAELNKADVDLKADIGRLTLNTIVLVDTSTALTLNGGTLQLKNRFAGPHGGRSASDLTLTTSGQSAEVDLDINMRDLRFNLMSGDVKDPSLIPPVGITVDVKSGGGSPRALAASANGRVLFTQGAGKIRNELVGKVSGDILAELFTALNPFAKHEEFTTLDCTIFALDIADGEADITGMFSQGKKIQVVGDGNIDLNTEKLNIEFNTKPRQGIGVSADMFVTPFVKLGGTLANPGIGLDKKGTLLTVATGGLWVLLEGAADRATAEMDRCDEVLEKVGDHPPLKH